MYGNWTDKVKDFFSDIKDKLDMEKEDWIHIGIAVGITSLIIIPILFSIAPSKSTYNVDMAQIDGYMAETDSYKAVNDVNIETISNQLGDILDLGPLATESQLGIISSLIADHSINISTLQILVGANTGRIDTVEDAMAEVVCSPPEGYLTGTFGDYTLYAESSKPGNFTANVYLVYSPPKAVGNATSYDEATQNFYGGINWTAPAVQGYNPIISYNGTAWGVSQVWFNIGMFPLIADTETAVDIKFTGLNSTYAPDFSYVEVYPVLS